MIRCRLCPPDKPGSLLNLTLHLRNVHRWTVDEYRVNFPDAPIIASEFQVGRMKERKGRLRPLSASAMVKWLLEDTGELPKLMSLARDYYRKYPALPWTSQEAELAFFLALRIREFVTGSTETPPLP